MFDMIRNRRAELELFFVRDVDNNIEKGKTCLYKKYGRCENIYI